MSPPGLSRSWSWLILVADPLSQLCRVTAPRSDIENLRGHDTGGIRVLIGEV